MAVTDLPDAVSSSAPASSGGEEAAPAPAPRAAPPLSAVLTLVLGLAITGLLLLAAAAVALTSDGTPEAAHSGQVEAIAASAPQEPPRSAPSGRAAEDGAAAADTPDTERDASSQIPALFPAEPSPVPQGLITDIEAASGEPLPVELGRLLSAIQEGFGQQSVQLAPELRAYAFRMASRFDWNPDTFRVAVTAPDAELAEARASTLRRLFESATGSERLQIRSGAGPHALTLVSDS